MAFWRDPVLRTYLRLQAFFLVTMTAHRLIFFFWHGEPGLLANSASDLARALWLGLRFDCSALIYANTPPILVYLIWRLFKTSRGWASWRRFAIGYWTLTFFLIQVLAIFDFFYYQHFQDRFNVVMIGLFTDDTRAILATMWKNYPLGYGLVTFAALGWLGHRTTRRWLGPVDPPTPVPLTASLATTGAVMALSILIGRGSLTFYPLGQIHTQVSSNPFINLLTVNAPFRTRLAIKQYLANRLHTRGNIRAFGYEGREAEAYRTAYGDYRGPIATLERSSAGLSARPPHLVVVLMESLGSYWFQYQSPDFDLVGPLREDLGDAFFTPNMVPGAIGTIGSLASLLSGVPHGSNSAILSESLYMNLTMPTSPAAILGRAGYTTRFVYAGNLGWRGIGSYARTQGFQKTDGEVEINRLLGPAAHGNHDWGVFDDRVFAYVEKIIGQATQPEFIVVMTTGNHPPFEVPPHYAKPSFTIPKELKDRLLVDEQLALDRFVALRFGNDSLSQFYRNIKKSGLTKNTALAVSGDHGFWFARIDADQVAARFLVPFAAWLPSSDATLRLRANLKDRFLSHLHILPTLYDFALTKGTRYTSFHPSLFSSTEPSGVSSQNFALYGEVAVASDFAPPIRCYNRQSEFLVQLIPCASAVDSTWTRKYQAFMATIDFYLEAVKAAGTRP